MRRILPILFNTEMVRAILDGRKTVTRRICKDGDDYTMPDMDFYDADKRTYAVHNYADKEQMDKLSTAERICPICPGDILYVRETWAFISCIECNRDYLPKGKPLNCYDTQAIEYDDGAHISDGCFFYRADYPYPERITWRPSIHMPKAAARIWLKVTDVRVERLQDITPEEAVREGAKETFPPLALDEFREIWESTIRKPDTAQYGWDANPWIWVIDYERCERPEPCILKGIAPAEDKRPCIGYQKSKENDEPCEMCKGCRACNGEELE